jgi:hypothetical protein
VSPHFPPANGADAHRVRTTIPFFSEFGWEVEVLSVAMNCLSVPEDAWLAEGIPGDIIVHCAQGITRRWSRIPGFGTLDLRARGALRRAGDRLLASKKFDLIYFSTTVFGILSLGVHWKRRFGVPFVIDYQDPWVSDYYRTHPQVTPPGGRLKYWVVGRMARWQEPRTLAECAGLTAVSPAYAPQLQARYPGLHKLPVLTAPFPGSLRDFDRAANGTVLQNCFDPNDGKKHWVCIGVSGAMMHKALRAFFSAVTRQVKTNPELRDRLRIHFIGTSYAPEGKAAPVVLPLAEAAGLDGMVDERTTRIPYSEALRCLKEADALIVPGSDESSYNASRLFPYLLARKPTLVMFHEKSPVSALVERVGGATLVPFGNDDDPGQLADAITREWFANNQYEKAVAIHEQEFAEFTDHGHALQLCQFFDSIVAANR